MAARSDVPASDTRVTSRMIRLRLLSALAIPCLVSHATAEERRLPIEFAVTESIVMTDRDEMYVSPAAAYFRSPDDTGLTVASEIAYGLTDRLQVATEVPYVFVNPGERRSASGIGDVEIAARYGLVNYREHAFGLDVGAALALPTGERRHDVAEDRLAVEPFFTTSMWLGPVNVQTNGAWERAVTRTDDEPANEGRYNVALVYPIERWFVVLEGNGETDREHTRYWVTPEAVWRATDSLELRAAVPCGVTRAAGDYGLVAGFTVEFEHLFHRSDGDGANALPMLPDAPATCRRSCRRRSGKATLELLREAARNGIPTADLFAARLRACQRITLTVATAGVCSSNHRGSDGASA